MLALRHGQRAVRAWILPLLLALFLAATLPSCINQGDVCGGLATFSTVVYASGRVYLFSPGAAEVNATSLYALRASDGKELWHAQGILQASDADHLYLLLDQEQVTILEALRASDGKVLWQSRQPVGFSTLGALDGSVYLYEDSDNALLALNAADGKERWKIEHTALSPGPDADTGNVSLQVVNGVVYARAGNGVLSAFREEDGALLWSHDFNSTFEAQSPWFIAHGTIYLSTYYDGLFALQASSGNPALMSSVLRVICFWASSVSIVRRCSTLSPFGNSFVDEYESLLAGGIHPLTGLMDYLQQSRDLGFHVIIARRGGVVRVGDNVVARLREMNSLSLAMNGDPPDGQGPGALKTNTLPPGRGYLVRRNQRPLLVQVAYSEPGMLNSAP